MTDYRAVNQANWNERVPVHVASTEYGVERFVTDPHRLSDVVRFDLPRLGDISGLRGVHLQCHIGTDTLSLSRCGARMTGVDFSAPALSAARDLAARAGAAIEYVESEVYQAPEALRGAEFDLVYTGIGAIGWLPSIDRWAAVVASLLKPGGRLFIRDAHPMMLALQDERADGLLVVDFPYFEQAQPTVWTEDGTYVDSDVSFTNKTTHEWNHGIGEIVTALMSHGMLLTQFVEHDTVPWNALAGQMAERDGEWRLVDRPERLPMSFTIQAIKASPDPPGLG